MNKSTIIKNLKNTIAAKEQMLAQNQSALALSYLGPTPLPGSELACVAVIKFLEVNLIELKNILKDVQKLQVE